MQKGRIIDLTQSLAIEASKLRRHYNLPMAASIILATAKTHDGTVWTQDADFMNVESVHYFARKNK